MTAPTDTTEKGLEDLIVRSLVEEGGYEQGSNTDYDRARTKRSSRESAAIAVPPLKCARNASR